MGRNLAWFWENLTSLTKTAPQINQKVSFQLLASSNPSSGNPHLEQANKFPLEHLSDKTETHDYGKILFFHEHMICPRNNRQ